MGSALHDSKTPPILKEEQIQCMRIDPVCGKERERQMWAGLRVSEDTLHASQCTV